jgi:histidyl-tRNA synthetase
MILDYEVPSGSNLYFGEQAYKRRILINTICDIFLKNNFEEIVTPYFSYTSLQNAYDNNKLISLKDKDNNEICLRCDSTLDVARLVTKRLGRSTSHKKWFYSQSVFLHPSTEFYQIGCEWLNCKDHTPILELLEQTLSVINKNATNTLPTLLLTNTKISSKVKKLLNFKNDMPLEQDVDKLLSLNKNWLNALVAIQSISDINNCLNIMPDIIKKDLEHLKQIALKVSINNKNIVLSPLYEVSTNYYDGICYSVFNGNNILIKGGEYKSNGFNSIGFGIFIDNILTKGLN